MKELDLQDKYIIHFLCERPDGLQYREAKANTVSKEFFINEDLKNFISDTTLNKTNYRKLLKKFSSEKELLAAFTAFLNGMFLGYNELKSNYNNQNARNNGRKKVAKDYLEAVQEYLQIAGSNDLSQTIRKDFLKIFEKAIHITSTDVSETYIIRNISNQFDEIKNTVNSGNYDFEDYYKKTIKDFKTYPVVNKSGTKMPGFPTGFPF